MASTSRKVKGIIYVEPILTAELANIVNLQTVKKWIMGITHFSAAKFEVKLIPADLNSKWDPETMASTTYTGFDEETKMFTYKFEFEDPMDSEEVVGALLVENTLFKERYIKKIDLNLDYGEHLIFNCESWVHSDRIFFTDKSYLPLYTPTGLKSLREDDLESLRGNGKGRREAFERIYDYDTYNDLGEPDIIPQTKLGRPTLGGEDHPYPRRCRTGRPMITKTGSDKITKEAESRNHLHFFQFYVPADESFSDQKIATFGTMEILFSIAQFLKPSKQKQKHKPRIASLMSEPEQNQSWFEKVQEYLVDKWTDLNHVEKVLKVVVPKLVKDYYNNYQTVKRIHNAQGREDDGEALSWFRDVELCRQTLAGINPYSIKLVTRSEWPLTSTLPSDVYGESKSAITEELVEKSINSHGLKGYITFDEALDTKRLFMLDYHDLFLPYVNRVRELDDTTLYGSRMLMFLMLPEETLTPVAIELTCPPNNGNPQWKNVYTPVSSFIDDADPDACLWKLAKAHVLAHDSGYHQLISHWLRTHCATEPYIIATHRCLSKMHPIHRLLFPHFRYTMQINALARQFLINADGIIEKTFSPGRYSMELSSHIYDKQWRFDLEGLPADLVSRGMAVEIEDKKAKKGVRLELTIKDYPFASDGLILWHAIEDWATAYVNYYYPHKEYPHKNLVESDEELKAWWEDIKTKGHEDKKVGWPELNSQEELIGIVTTIMWVTSGHHSAVNFGQYTGGYLPHRPTIARTKMPDEDRHSPEWTTFLDDPVAALKKCFANDSQSSKVKTTLNVLSSHAQDEEYIGEKIKVAWEVETDIKAAFHTFYEDLKKLESEINRKNGDDSLNNRVGKAGEARYPYELLKPFSEPGVTGKGVPYSISI